MIAALRANVGRWVDASTPLSASVCAAVKAAGYVGVIRTLPLPSNSTAADLTAPELERILAADLQCSAYQHVRGEPPTMLWQPRAHDGAADAVCAANFARAAGLPAGCHIWQDLEAVDGTAFDTLAYSRAWGVAMIGAGYLAGLYVGYAVPCSPDELAKLPHTSYWSDAGPRQVATRGFSVRQRQPEIVIAGVHFDPDEVSADLLGDTPIVCGAGELAAA
jgi:glycoside hydrolase-like protein